MKNLGVLIVFLVVAFLFWEGLVNAISSLNIKSPISEYDLARDSSIPAKVISPSPNNQKEPAIYRDKVVWSEYIGNYWQIILYDLATKTRIQLTNNALDHTYPSIYGEDIIWWEGEAGGADRIGGLNYVTLQSIVLPTHQAVSPKIGSNGIVWIEGSSSNPLQFFFFPDTQTRTLDTGAIKNWPASSENVVVWTDYRSKNPDIYGYDLATQHEFPIAINTSEQDQPDISGNIVVWQDNRRTESLSSFDIYGYDLALAKEFVISARGGNEVSPKVSDNFVIWTDYVGSTVDIYAYNLSTQKLLTVAANTQANIQPAIFNSTVVWVQAPSTDRNALLQIVIGQLPDDQ